MLTQHLYLGGTGDFALCSHRLHLDGILDTGKPVTGSSLLDPKTCRDCIAVADEQHYQTRPEVRADLGLWKELNEREIALKSAWEEALGWKGKWLYAPFFLAKQKIRQIALWILGIIALIVERFLDAVDLTWIPWLG